MLNISKYQQAIVGGAIVTVSSICLGQSAGFAQTTPQPPATNQSNATGANVTTTNGSPTGLTPGGPTGFSSTQRVGAGSAFNNLAVAAQNAQAATDRVNALNTAPAPAPQAEGPVRYSGVADAGDCACPNVDTASKPAPAANPELEAAKAAEAEANAKLAAAKAEARSFIESVEKENAAGSKGSIQIW